MTVLAVAVVTVTVLAATVVEARTERSAASRPVAHQAASRAIAHSAAYCSSIPTVPIEREAWGFHAGQPIPNATSSYARGHGKIDLYARTVSGVICQAARARNAPERQIILSIGHRLAYASHHAVMFGVPGNIMKIYVQVESTTDPKCPVGTRGQVTIFASYNGVHEDSVQFSFPAACRDHRRRYTGTDVVTNVPPN